MDPFSVAIRGYPKLGEDSGAYAAQEPGRDQQQGASCCVIAQQRAEEQGSTKQVEGEAGLIPPSAVISQRLLLIVQGLIAQPCYHGD